MSFISSASAAYRVWVRLSQRHLPPSPKAFKSGPPKETGINSVNQRKQVVSCHMHKGLLKQVLEYLLALDDLI
jgi:hypothetical protein